MNQAELIETTKTAIQGSEAEVARKIEVTPQSLSDFKKGKRAMPDRIAIRLARLAGLDPASTLAEIEAEKADEETREVRREIARRAARSIAATVLALVLGIGSATDGRAVTLAKTEAYKVCILCKVTLRGRLRRILIKIRDLGVFWCPA
jgi:plasmid maintenance system antidote protein VapI